jgi:hypothetical protein
LAAFVQLVMITGAWLGEAAHTPRLQHLKVAVTAEERDDPVLGQQ